MTEVPKNMSQAEFFLLPAPFIALVVGICILSFIFISFKFPHIRQYLRPIFKIYYVIALTPIYIGAGFIYIITLTKVNIIEKLRNVDFFEKFKKIYLDPVKFFEEMRLNPTNYHLWVGIYICAAQITIDYILIVWVSEIFMGGNDMIIFGIISSEPPSIINPIARWIYMSLISQIIWWPTKFTIYFLVELLHKYDKSDEPNRPWYDKVRLTYIAWAYIITADAVWCLGMVLTLVLYIFMPIWEILIFTWIAIIICGLIELTYQQFSLHGLFKLSWTKSFLIWLLSMIPFLIMALLLVQILGSQVNLII